jgi:hypothetical protein
MACLSIDPLAEFLVSYLFKPHKRLFKNGWQTEFESDWKRSAPSRINSRPHNCKTRLRGLITPRRRGFSIGWARIDSRESEECPIRWGFCQPSILRDCLRGANSFG